MQVGANLHMEISLFSRCEKTILSSNNQRDPRVTLISYCAAIPRLPSHSPADYLPGTRTLCPTTQVEVRRGPSRARTSLTIPILPSFLFYPILNFSHGMTLSLPRFSSRLHVMRRPPPQSPSASNPPLPPNIPHIPPTSYAFCSLRIILSARFRHCRDFPSTQRRSIVVPMSESHKVACWHTRIMAQIRDNG